MSDNLTFLVTAQGAPFTPAGFGNWFRECCDAVGLKNCSAHGLRKAAARRLAEAGNSTNAIAAVTGHTTLKEVERYTRDADQARLADQAIATLPGGENDEQKLSNHPKWLDNTGEK
jgi:integrase